MDFHPCLYGTLSSAIASRLIYLRAFNSISGILCVRVMVMVGSRAHVIPYDTTRLLYLLLQESTL